MISKLIVDGVELGFTDTLPISTNLSVADIREPDKRNSTYSKTISIPATKEANEVFEYAFELNLSLSSFNPNIAISAKYFVNEVIVFDGQLQLLSITSKYNGSFLDHFYNCSMIGETGNIFVDIANLFLTDIDLSVYNHVLDIGDVTSSWATPIGVGFVYPYIDYGVNGGNSNDWYLEGLKPAMFEKEYVDRIFANAGYTYTSNFFTSNYYKRIITPDVDEGCLKLPASSVINAQFYAGSVNISPITIYTIAPPTTITLTVWRYGPNNSPIALPVLFNDDSTAPFNDPGGVYNIATNVFTTSIPGIYTIVFNLDCYFFINMPVSGVTVEGSQNLLARIDRLISGTWTPVVSNFFNVVQSSPLSGIGSVVAIPVPTITLQIPGNFYTSGEQFRCSVFSVSSPGWLIRTAGGTLVTSGSSFAGLNMRDATTTFYSIIDGNLPYGGGVLMNDTIPKNIKQIDFLTSIIKSENLYVEVDKTNNKNLIIEPREDFIQYNNSLDWTRKQDLSNPIITLPMGDLDAKKYTWTFKSDKDVYNAFYEDKYKEVYGNKILNVTNDFIKSEKTIDVIFSATPGVALQNDIVAGRMYVIDNGLVKPIKCNIRRLYWGGLKNCNGHNFWFAGNPSQTSQYPYAGHVDDPNSPTIDICFDNPKELYWILAAQSYTNNNLFGRGYFKLLQEITDPNSKIVQCKIYLDETDINEFSFRKIIFINGSYFFVNKISNYDPQVRTVCDVELLKLKKGQIFFPFSYPPTDVPPGGNTNFIRFQSPNLNPTGNYFNSRSASIGFNIINFGQDVLISGSDFSAGIGVKDQQLIGMNTGSADAAYNGKMTARNGAMIIGDSGINVLKKDRIIQTADFTIDDSVQLYYVDATLGSITVTLPSVDLNNSEYTLVRIDGSANIVTVVGHNGTELIQSTGISATFDSIFGFTTRRYTTNYLAWFY